MSVHLYLCDHLPKSWSCSLYLLQRLSRLTVLCTRTLITNSRNSQDSAIFIYFQVTFSVEMVLVTKASTLPYHSLTPLPTSTVSSHHYRPFKCSETLLKNQNVFEIPTWCRSHAERFRTHCRVQTIRVSLTFLPFVKEGLLIRTLSRHWQLHVTLQGFLGQLTDCIVPITDLVFDIQVTCWFGVSSGGRTYGTLECFCKSNIKSVWLGFFKPVAMCLSGRYDCLWRGEVRVLFPV